MTKILFIDNGIEFDGDTVRRKPVGGAENAFVSLVEELAKLNFEVVVFNNVRKTNNINGVLWKKLNHDIYHEKFDILVINRGDNFLNFKRECKKRFFWIHNPANYLLKWRYLSKLYLNSTTIIFSSNYHLSTYPKWAPNKNKIIIPYGVDNFIFENKTFKLPKKKNAIFTSNPLRGLDWLLDRWEYEIYPQLPESTLELFTGSKTYGSFGLKHEKKMMPILERAKKLKGKGVNLNEPINRVNLIEKLQSTRLFLYQGSKDETFCMSLAEAQTIGIPSVVMNLGCMNERVRHNKSGYVCETDIEFSKSAVKILEDDVCWSNLNSEMVLNTQNKNWSEIAKEWKKILI